MKIVTRIKLLVIFAFVAALVLALALGPRTGAQSRSQQPQAQDQQPSSFTPVIEEPFNVVRARDKAAKARHG